MLPKANGLAKANAQGQAIISTAVNTCAAFEGSVTNQKVVANTAIHKIVMVKYLLIVSVRLVNEADLSLLNTSLLHNWVR
jgi:predicted membrane protein